MSMSENDWRREQPRPSIHCPGCGRELFNLHRPQCLWCGAAISDSDYQAIAAQSQRSWQQPAPPPTAIPPYDPLFGSPSGLYGPPRPLLPWSGRSAWGLGVAAGIRLALCVLLLLAFGILKLLHVIHVMH